MENKSNFTPKAKEGIFLGFSKKNYSYRIMDIKNKRIHHVCKDLIKSLIINYYIIN